MVAVTIILEHVWDASLPSANMSQKFNNQLEACMKKIVLTGGGTAGHVTPNLALLPSLAERGYEVHYIGSYNGIERKLIEDA